jgi:hypothetical protein
MNERIRELAELSIKESGQEFWWLTNDLVIEKFAELIVRECIDVVGKSTASPTGYQALMKHFGVEE